jgi:replication initiation and membrane attachment protein
MKITNMLFFTEQHHYNVNRDFSLSAIDYKILTIMYQPMIGAFAISLYYTLYHQISLDRVGKSTVEQQRKLFLSLDIEPSEKGRKYFIEQTSKLEAVGLLNSSRAYLLNEDDYIYEYQLFAPLSPNEFFRNQHLTLLLRDKIGKYMLLSLREELFSQTQEQLEKQSTEDLSVPFYDLFKLNTKVTDFEIEEVFLKSSTPTELEVQLDTQSKSFNYSDIIRRFPRKSNNREFVEALKHHTDQMAAINFIAKKYTLTLQEMCRLLDEDGIFSEDGQVFLDQLQYYANMIYRQEHKRQQDRERQLHRQSQISKDSSPDQQLVQEYQSNSVEMQYYLDPPVAIFKECTDHQYNFILRNEPYLFVLKKFFPNGVIPDGILSVFEKVDFHYKLKSEVINVLIHFIYVDRRSWSKSSIEAVVADMLGKQIATYEQAVDYIKGKIAYKANLNTKNEFLQSPQSQLNREKKIKQKPHIPAIQQLTKSSKITEEELEAMRSRAKKLDEKFNR